MDNQWIVARERLPNHGQQILATLQCDEKAVVTIIKYNGEQHMKGCKLTAWMPVPDAYISEIVLLYKMVCAYLRKGRSGINDIEFVC